MKRGCGIVSIKPSMAGREAILSAPVVDNSSGKYCIGATETGCKMFCCEMSQAVLCRVSGYIVALVIREVSKWYRGMFMRVSGYRVSLVISKVSKWYQGMCMSTVFNIIAILLSTKKKELTIQFVCIYSGDQQSERHFVFCTWPVTIMLVLWYRYHFYRFCRKVLQEVVSVLQSRCAEEQLEKI